MPVHDVGYRAWEGHRTSPASRWSIISFSGIRLAAKSKWVRRIIFVAWLPVMYWGIGFFFVEKALDIDNRSLAPATEALGQIPSIPQPNASRLHHRFIRHFILAPSRNRAKSRVFPLFFSKVLRVSIAWHRMEMELVHGISHLPVIDSLGFKGLCQSFFVFLHDKTQLSQFRIRQLGNALKSFSFAQDNRASQGEVTEMSRQSPVLIAADIGVTKPLATFRGLQRIREKKEGEQPADHAKRRFVGKK